jgi:hypothetical protein
LELAKRDKELLQAGERIRFQAINRRGSTASNELEDMESNLYGTLSAEENEGIKRPAIEELLRLTQKMHPDYGNEGARVVYTITRKLWKPESMRAKQEDMRLCLEKQLL